VACEWKCRVEMNERVDDSETEGPLPREADHALAAGLSNLSIHVGGFGGVAGRLPDAFSIIFFAQDKSTKTSSVPQLALFLSHFARFLVGNCHCRSLITRTCAITKFGMLTRQCGQRSIESGCGSNDFLVFKWRHFGKAKNGLLSFPPGSNGLTSKFCSF
jgi:hypothetical protein